MFGGAEHPHIYGFRNQPNYGLIGQAPKVWSTIHPWLSGGKPQNADLRSKPHTSENKSIRTIGMSSISKSIKKTIGGGSKNLVLPAQKLPINMQNMPGWETQFFSMRTWKSIEFKNGNKTKLHSTGRQIEQYPNFRPNSCDLSGSISYMAFDGTENRGKR